MGKDVCFRPDGLKDMMCVAQPVEDSMEVAKLPKKTGQVRKPNRNPKVV